MKITKRPKLVTIEYQEYKAYSSKYQCPTCKTIYQGFGPQKNVTRFICECGQELIVKNQKNHIGE